MEQTIEDLKNKDIQIELRKKYYDDLSSKKKELGQKGAYTTILCYCNRFHSKTTGITERHKSCKTHQDYCIKIKNEEKMIKEKNPEYLLWDHGEFLYKNQFIKYYYFTTIDILSNK
jgi:hypothetical protein